MVPTEKMFLPGFVFLIEEIPSREEHKKPVQCLPNIRMGFAWTNWHNLDSSIARGTLSRYIGAN
jgi:hypothetical protein